jgi:2-polyprenyl-3-methyl-5-hydroxy-6-metoxy-1,4-benzoquinol methylase
MPKEGEPMAAPTAAIDEAKMHEFVGKALGDLSSATVTFMASIGDKLGLYKDLVANGPATSRELADRTGLNERYLREWLGGQASAGYLTYDPATGRFTLPAEHAPVLAEEGGPVFFGGAYQMMPPWMGAFSGVVEAFRKGGGVQQATYGDEFWSGFERFSGGWFQNLLVPIWIPAMPDVQAKLEKAADVADVGCGRGRALIALAKEYPNGSYVGYDNYPPTIEIARERAAEAGVSDRVRFEVRDVATAGLPEEYDIVTTFDVVHDSANPRGLLKAIRKGLRSDGVYVNLEINASDKVEENAGVLGAFFYAASTFYCMTTSLASGGEGLGTLGMNEKATRELCAEAGFSSVRRVPMENPFNILYEIRP